MTPELQKDLIVSCVSVVATALFTGVPAIALFWWTWRRDQERLMVQKYLLYANTFEGKTVLIRGEDQIPPLGILIRNRSLFPVRVSSVGFKIGKRIIEIQNFSYVEQGSDDSGATVIPSGSFMILNTFGEEDRNSIRIAIANASRKFRLSPADLVQGKRVSAMVALESGRIFTSLPLSRRLFTLFRKR